MTPKLRLLNSTDVHVCETEDGSHTIQRKDSGWMYRSSHGALQESQSVFVDGSLLTRIEDRWRVLELGFGTGMNFFCTKQTAKENHTFLYYETIDHLPVPPEFGTDEISQQALSHVRESGSTARIKFDGGVLVLHPNHFLETTPQGPFNAIFHDPFGPLANPECWTKECFTWQVPLLSTEGIWTSYGASGQMRRELASTGLYVAIGTGIGKKRETTRASKSKEALHGYKIKYTPPSIP